MHQTRVEHQERQVITPLQPALDKRQERIRQEIGLIFDAIATEIRTEELPGLPALFRYADLDDVLLLSTPGNIARIEIEREGIMNISLRPGWEKSKWVASSAITLQAFQHWLKARGFLFQSVLCPLGFTIEHLSAVAHEA
jgi:hypothetical protein